MSKKEERMSQIEKLYNTENMSQRQISEKLGISESIISRYVKELKKEGRIRDKKEEQREKIKELTAKGLGQKEIAEKLGVSSSLVSIYLKKVRNEKEQENENKKYNLNDLERRYNSLELTESDMQEFNGYLSNCKKRLMQEKLDRTELNLIKKLITLTDKYSDIIFYIRACVYFNQLDDAIKFANYNRDNENLTKEQRAKIADLSKKLLNLKKKSNALNYLKRGAGILETAKSSGLSETEVIKLNRKLQEKKKTSKSVGTAGEGR